MSNPESIAHGRQGLSAPEPIWIVSSAWQDAELADEISGRFGGRAARVILTGEGGYRESFAGIFEAARGGEIRPFGSPGFELIFAVDGFGRGRCAVTWHVNYTKVEQAEAAGLSQDSRTTALQLSVQTNGLVLRGKATEDFWRANCCRVEFLD